jgi:cold shock CspA family protein
MEIPLEIVFKDIPRISEIESLIRTKTETLGKLCDKITFCRVTIEKPQKNHRIGNSYRTKVEIIIPHERSIFVSREVKEKDYYDPISRALRQSFDSAHKVLLKIVEKKQYEKKFNAPKEIMGEIKSFDYEKGCGYIKTTDGEEVYFDKSNVKPEDFDNLEEGVNVLYFHHNKEKYPEADYIKIFKL